MILNIRVQGFNKQEEAITEVKPMLRSPIPLCTYMCSDTVPRMLAHLNHSHTIDRHFAHTHFNPNAPRIGSGCQQVQQDVAIVATASRCAATELISHTNVGGRHRLRP
jgi:hypothetical protein